MNEVHNRSDGNTFEIWETENGDVEILQQGFTVTPTIVGSAMPDDNDGSPDGTIYVQV